GLRAGSLRYLFCFRVAFSAGDSRRYNGAHSKEPARSVRFLSGVPLPERKKFLCLNARLR
ncbi:MAG: hypothetical protein ABI016_06280, partial [Chthoniobacterales bacterium]